jgi:hypothetical protein
MQAGTVTDAEKWIPVYYDVDVAVLGGGAAGTLAAIIAARLGARTVLVERTGALGGVATTGLMGSMGNRYYDYRLRQLLGGLPVEVIERLVAAGGTQFPDVEDTLKGKMGKPLTVPFRPEILSYVLLEMAQEAGVEIMLQTHFSHLLGEGPRPQGLVVVNKSGPGAVLAKAMVDASGDADLAVASGAPCTEQQTSWGLLMRLGNVDLQRVMDMVLQLQPWQPWPEFGPWLSRQVGLPLEELQQDRYWSHILDPVRFGHAPMENPDDVAFTPKKLKYIQDRWEIEGLFYNIELPLLRHLLKEAVDAGDLALVKKIQGFGEMRLNWDGFAGGAWGPGVALVNSCHAMAGFDGTDGKHVSRAEREGRIYCMEIARFLVKYVPGFQSAFLIDMGWQFVPRHARMIDGEYQVTGKDVRGTGTRFPDAILLRGGVTVHYGEPDQIPYRVLVPKKVDNVLVAGKCASQARFFRSIPCCMAMGEAAGTAAVLMAERGVANRDIDISLLQKMLREQGVILGPSV